MKKKTLIINGMILTMDELQENLIHCGFIVIEDGNIQKVGKLSEVDSSFVNSIPDIIDASGKLVMPGLINTHTHAAMTLFRGLADDIPLMTWLQNHIFPAESKAVNPEMVYWCSKLAAAEMILSGTTTVADGYFHEGSAAEAFAEAGLRSVAAQGVIDFPAPGVPDPAYNIDKTEDFIESWQGKNDLISPAVFCHSPYTCSSETLQKAKKLANRMNTLFFIHLAETKGEVEQTKAKHNTTPVQYLNSLGILDENTVCVHCVWLDEEDIKIIAQTGCGVSTCPDSNMKLASGVAPLDQMLKGNITIGLGTDGCASNNTLDIFAAMDLCAKVHKVKKLDPTVVSAGEVLKMATIDGARVLGMKKITGSLTPGKRADIIMLDLQQPHMQPMYNADNLVYAARGSDISTAIIDGNLVMKDRKILTIDIEEIKERVRSLSRDLTETI